MPKKANPSYRPVTDAFGVGSPNWNVPFPNGNLTAPEIAAYFPHWFKSVDVIDRCITNGGNAKVVAEMVSQYRRFPGNRETFPSNSMYIMMKDAMRRAGFTDWVVGKHKNHFTADRTWNSGKLNVHNFRTPRITHPKASNSCRNDEASPVPFASLTLHVKQHPTGPDALDLTRCVLYAQQHPNENWLFPTHFQALVKKLGGSRSVTRSNWDASAFRRVEASRVPPPKVSRSRKINSAKNSAPKPKKEPAPQNPRKRTRAEMAGPRKKRRVAKKDDFIAGSDSEDDLEGIADENKGIGRPLKRKADSETEEAGLDLRVRQLRKKVKVNYQESTPRTTDSGIISPQNEDDGDWAVENGNGAASEESDDEASLDSLEKYSLQNHFAAGVDDDLHALQSNAASLQTIPNGAGRATAGRHAAKEARRKVQEAMAIPFKMPEAPKVKTYSREVEEEALKYCRGEKETAYLKPHPLSRGRLQIDEINMWLYAEEGAKDPWASAMDCYRFRGPRRHPPFRELHRLSDPDPNDISDFAENIRWAKEQHKLFGSVWTEYPYSMECITEHRITSLWVSEELVSSGKFPDY